MKVGIMAAMPEEISTLTQNIENVEITSIADRDYYTGKLYGIETTLVFSRWGKVASASTATTLISVFNVDLVIFTGVAGAVDTQLNVGDIVIGSGLYQHDMDARPLFKRHQIPLTNLTIFRPEEQLIKKACLAAETFMQNITPDFVQTLKSFNVISPNIYQGIIASGDQFVSNASAHDALKLEEGKVMAVEMEGAAVAQVCHDYKVPYIIIRTISDKADHSASVDFQKFVSEVATHYSEGIVENLYQLL